MTPAPFLIDPDVQKLAELADSSDWMSIAGGAALETAQRAYARCPPAASILAGAEAAGYLEALIPIVEADLLAHHDAYGSVRWLWYLRRAPDLLFEGDYGTTLGYDRALAEVMSSRFTASDRSNAIDRVRFRTDESAFRQLARYVGRIKLLSTLHMFYRRVGKGATLDVSRPIFTVTSSESVADAIEIYDERHDRAEGLTFPGLGLAVIPPDVRTLTNEDSPDNPTGFLSLPCSPSTTTQVAYPDGEGGLTMVVVRARHALRALNLNAILRPFEEFEVPGYLGNIAALVELLLLLPSICSNVPWALSSVVQQGYAFVGEDRLRAIVERDLPSIVSRIGPFAHSYQWPQTYDEWLTELQAVAASSWPLASGNVIRRFERNLLIDTTGASQALLSRLEVGRSPLHGNQRAHLFERQCQTAIDTTRWAPGHDIRALRGRTLRRNGVAITDMDAVGTHGDSLLIVSCKSIIYDRAYDRGDFRVVRNIQATVDEAVAAWDIVADDLRNRPVGDNFDFSAFNQIVGVVCTPFVAYTDNDRSLSFVRPGLRSCMSLIELRDWLND